MTEGTVVPMTPLTAGQFEAAVLTLGSIARAIRELPLDEMLEAIAKSEQQKALHRPTGTQVQNIENIKQMATACLELRTVAHEIAERQAQATKSRIILPFGPSATQ